MQRPERDHIREPTNFVLQYPTIAVHGTPENWLSHSQVVTMASSHDDGSFEDTTSSLGDSSYDFIDDRSIATSDDEESQSAMTHSISSDEHDLDRNSGQPPPPLAPDNNVRVSQSPNLHIDSVFAHRGDTLQSESQLTDRTIDLHDGSANKADLSDSRFAGQEEDSIRLTEPTPSGLREPVEGSDTLRVYTGGSVAQFYPSFLPDLSSEKVTVTVKQTMVSQGVLLEEPYKVLYVGDDLVKDSIIQKLGAALAATARTEDVRPSKFNIVPISSFGDTASPDVVLIDSSGLELSVDECTSAIFVRRDEGNDTIRMALSDGMMVESSWSGSDFSVSEHWTLPDVAIFYLSPKDTISAKQTKRFTRSFMNRHTVPTIIISDVPLESTGTGTNTPDSRTPHLLLESHGPCPIAKCLPIDLPTFLQLDASQLSRNLAYLALSPSSPASNRRSLVAPKVDNGRARVAIKDVQQFFGMFDKVCKLLPLALFILIPTLLFHLITSNTIRQYQTPESVVDKWGIAIEATTTLMVSSPQPTSIVPTSTHSQTSVVSNAVTSLSQSVHVPKSILTAHENTDITAYLASFLIEGHPLMTNNSDKFKVHVIGDRHVILQPPYWFTRTRKAPKLLFNVTREGLILEHEVSPLFDGVYSLKLRRADAYGLLNVSVWTISKPKIHETFQVALKTSWLSMDGWKKAADDTIDAIRGDLDSIRKNLAITRTHTGEGLQRFVQNASVKAAACTKEAARLKTASRHLSKKWKGRQNAIIGDLSRHARILGRNVALRAGNRRSMIVGHAGRLPHDVQAFVHKFSKFRAEHIRRTQKSALKAWWSISGVPRQKSLKETKGSVHKRTVHPKKRISR